MAKIKKIGKYKPETLKNELGFGFEYKLISKNSLLTDIIKNNKFVHYASFSSKEMIGAISLYSEGRKNIKWEIRNLYLGDYGEEIAKKLVSYVVNKYGGEGAERFVAYIPEKYNLLVNLLKKECLFRSCANVEVWQSELKKLSFEKPPFPLQDLKNNDIVPLLELYNYCLFPQFRQSLSTDKNYWLTRTSKASIKQVLYISNIMEGYVNLHQPSENLFYADILMSEFYQHLYPDLIKYCIYSAKKINPAAKIVFVVKKFHQSSKIYATTLQELGFRLDEAYVTLLKDYWEIIKKPAEENSASILFNHIGSPA